MVSRAAFVVTITPRTLTVSFQSSLREEEITLSGLLRWRKNSDRVLKKWWLSLSSVYGGVSSLFRRHVCLPLHESACQSPASDEPYLPAFHTPGAFAISPAVAVPTALVSSCFLSPGTKSQRRLFVSPLWQPYYYKLIIGLLVLDAFSSTVTCNNWRAAITVCTHLCSDFSMFWVENQELVLECV